MIDRPEPLSVKTLNDLKSISPGEGAKCLELWRQEYEHYLEYIRNDANQKIIEQKHLRNYRILTVMSGTFLATASLALCAFAINKSADLLPLAGVLGPIAGIAGVFVWGYRPNKGK